MIANIKSTFEKISDLVWATSAKLLKMCKKMYFIMSPHPSHINLFRTQEHRLDRETTSEHNKCCF